VEPIIAVCITILAVSLPLAIFAVGMYKIHKRRERELNRLAATIREMVDAIFQSQTRQIEDLKRQLEEAEKENR
jgi:hypothetical protein